MFYFFGRFVSRVFVQVIRWFVAFYMRSTCVGDSLGMAKSRKNPTSRQQCGTDAGYRQHMKRGERACDACKRAHAEKQLEYRQKRGVSPRKPTKAERREADEQRGAALLEAVEKVEDAAPVEDGYPAFLRRGGRDLWDSVRANYDLDPTGEVLLLEACRLKDRLDKFTAALSSNSTLWFELKEPEELKDGTVQMQVVVNSMVSEARQAQAALGQTLGKIGVLQQAEKRSSGVSMMDQLKSKREERLASQRAGA